MVGAPAAAVRDRALERGEDLERVGALGGNAGRDVPEHPRRAVHERIGEQRSDVGVVREARVDGAHRLA